MSLKIIKDDSLQLVVGGDAFSDFFTNGADAITSQFNSTTSNVQATSSQVASAATTINNVMSKPMAPGLGESDGKYFEALKVLIGIGHLIG